MNFQKNAMISLESQMQSIYNEPTEKRMDSMRYGGSPFGDIKLTTTAKDVRFANERMYIVLTDEREISVPLTWFPILLHATPQEREKWKIVHNGVGLRWEEIDEDISVKGLLGPFC